MRPRLFPPAVPALILGFVLAGLPGCDTFHGWTQMSTGRAATAGASVNVPLGK